MHENADTRIHALPGASRAFAAVAAMDFQQEFSCFENGEGGGHEEHRRAVRVAASQ